MDLILSLILIIIVIVIYILLIQIFTVLFRITGLTKQKSRFQVISLLTNSGFSTAESELIVNNRSRRKIAKYAMIIGTIFNVAIVSLLINIMVNVNWDNEANELITMGYAFLSLAVVILLIRLPFFRRGTERLIERIATRINEKNHHENVITELDAYGSKTISEVYVFDVPEILKDRSIVESGLMSKYNIYILLIQRKGRVIDVKKNAIIQKGDKLVLFAKTSDIRDVFEANDDKKFEQVEEFKENIISVMDNYGSNAMVEIEIGKMPEILLNKSLAESKLKENYDINILMIKHNDKAILVDGNTKLEVGDDVVLFGPYEHIKALFV